MGYTYPGNGDTLIVDTDKCTACARCLDVCPHGVLEIHDGTVSIARRSSCMECGACALNCPFGAISVSRGVGCAAAIINKYIGKKGECSCDTDNTCC